MGCLIYILQGCDNLPVKTCNECHIAAWYFFFWSLKMLTSLSASRFCMHVMTFYIILATMELFDLPWKVYIEKTWFQGWKYLSVSRSISSLLVLGQFHFAWNVSTTVQWSELKFCTNICDDEIHDFSDFWLSIYQNQQIEHFIYPIRNFSTFTECTGTKCCIYSPDNVL